MPVTKGNRIVCKEKSHGRPERPCTKNARIKWRGKDYEAIPKRMKEQQRTLSDVCGDPDLPSYPTWVAYVREHPELREKARRIHHSFPYSVQIKIQDVSPDFRKDCEDLRAREMTYANIAKTLEASKKKVTEVLRDSDKKTRPGRHGRGNS